VTSICVIYLFTSSSSSSAFFSLHLSSFYPHYCEQHLFTTFPDPLRGVAPSRLWTVSFSLSFHFRIPAGGWGTSTAWILFLARSSRTVPIGCYSGLIDFISLPLLCHVASSLRVVVMESIPSILCLPFSLASHDGTAISRAPGSPQWAVLELESNTLFTLFPAVSGISKQALS
jgi:hypothetical protein